MKKIKPSHGGGKPKPSGPSSRAAERVDSKVLPAGVSLAQLLVPRSTQLSVDQHGEKFLAKLQRKEEERLREEEAREY
ncbi:hypothetical protein HDV03_003068, partial [Kappamyces sp. JEL0829]